MCRRIGAYFGVRLSLPGLPDGAGLWADLRSEDADTFRPGTRVLAKWDEAAPGQPIYSATAIETGLALRLVFHQSLRQTEDLLRSIADVLEIDIAIPDHTTLSRWGGGLAHPAEDGRS